MGLDMYMCGIIDISKNRIPDGKAEEYYEKKGYSLIDKKDYDSCDHVLIRDSARSIILQGEKVALIHSLKYDYYKFPGGGVESGESIVDALLRETQEEAGLLVIPASVKEYGYVSRVQKSAYDPTEKFVQNNYYYLCRAEETLAEQSLVGYESEECFTLEYVDPLIAISVNRNLDHGPKDSTMIERDTRVLEYLIEEKEI